MLKLLSSHWLKILIILAIVGLIVSVVLRIFTPTPPPPAAVIKTDLPPIAAAFKFDYLHLDIPDQLDVFMNTTPQSSPLALAQTLADQLNLTASPDLASYWLSADGEQVLRIRSDQIISYSRPSRSAGRLTAGPVTANPDQATFTARQFLTSLDIYNLTDLQLSPPQPKFLDEQATLEPSTETPANIYEFTLQQNINNLPLITNDHIMPNALIWTYLDGELYRADFYPQATNWRKVNAYQTLSLAEIEQQIRNNQYTVINVGRTNPFTDDRQLNQLSTITFTVAQLEYRSNSTNGYVLPYLHFSGTGTDQNNNKFNIDIITPVVATNN